MLKLKDLLVKFILFMSNIKNNKNWKKNIVKGKC